MCSCDFIGKHIYPIPFQSLYGLQITSVVGKAFPNDKTSTLWLVKCKGAKGILQIYEDEII